LRNRLGLCALFVSTFASAALAAPDPPATPTATPATATVSPAREAAARELFRVFGGLKTTEAGAEAMLTSVRSNPQLARYEDVFRAWYVRTMAKSGFEAKIVALYAETFTQQELEDLTAFYRSPLGQKALSRVPELMKRGAEIGLEAAKANQPELERMLEEKRKEFEAADAAAATPTPTKAPATTPTPPPKKKRS
jgi:uncharacterized protein